MPSNRAIQRVIPTVPKLSRFEAKRRDAALSQRNFVLRGTLIYLATLIFEAPLRMAMAKAHIATLLYARDLLAVLIICVALFGQYAIYKRQRNLLILLSYVLVTGFFLSITLGNNLFSAGFGAKIFLTTLLGVAVGCYVDEDNPTLKKATVAIFVITSLGIVANYFYGIFPWEGGEFESAFGTSAVSKVWWIEGGIRRLAGLTRTSTLAATAIGMTGAAIMLYWRNPIGKMLVFAIGLVAIYMTTSKGLLIAYASAAFIALLPSNSPLQKLAAKSITVLYAVLGLAAPFISWFLDYSPDAIRKSPQLLSSFADRVSQSWPDTLRNFQSWYQWIVGQGLGEVGISKELISAKRVPPTDNMHLYMFCNFGLLGFVLFVLFCYYTIASVNKRGVTPAFAAIHVALGYGIVANIVDDAFTPIALMLAWCMLNRQEASGKSHAGV